jgi:cytosine/adenosine deaminase-related metal-dependent hydrolase
VTLLAVSFPLIAITSCSGDTAQNAGGGGQAATSSVAANGGDGETAGGSTSLGGRASGGRTASAGTGNKNRAVEEAGGQSEQGGSDQAGHAGMSDTWGGEANGGVPTGSDAGSGGAANGACDSDRPSIVKVGTAGRSLLRGTIVTPDRVFVGEVLTDGDTITCVAPSCASAANAELATVVETGGIIFPGLIDTHNHVLFDAFDETDWSPLQAYNNHNQWTNEARYGALVDAKQYLNGEGTDQADFGCELDKYGELKALVAGTTSLVGAANPASKACYGSLVRSVDQAPNGLGTDKVQVATLFPATSAADGVCNNFASGKTDAYLIHIAEGVDATALKEFATLNTITTQDGCLYSPKTAIVHGIALGDAELTVMAAHEMSLVWSPRSDVFLYGGGTNLNKTTNIPLALSKGINIALAPDWSIGGSQNLLDELRFARRVGDGVWGNTLSSKQLVQMVTTNAARVLGLQGVLGSLEAGKKADLMVIRGDVCAPYDALLAATPADVQLVMIGGRVLYGDSALATLPPASPACEALTICSAAKFVCVATASNTVTDKLDQTFATIKNTLEKALTDYDGLNLSQWDFAPLTPLVRCQ